MTDSYTPTVITSNTYTEVTATEIASNTYTEVTNLGNN